MEKGRKSTERLLNGVLNDARRYICRLKLRKLAGKGPFDGVKFDPVPSKGEFPTLIGAKNDPFRVDFQRFTTFPFYDAIYDVLTAAQIASRWACRSDACCFPSLFIMLSQLIRKHKNDVYYQDYQTQVRSRF